VAAQFFGEGDAQAVEAPLSGGVGGGILDRVLGGDGGDVDDVPGLSCDNHGREGANDVVGAT
jgi:hypothetical protein